MKIFKYLITTVVCLCSLFIFSQEVIYQEKPVQVVLLAGQSNMAGGGNYEELDISLQKRIEKISDRVLLIYNGSIAKPLSYYDNTPSEKRNFTKRFGPELLLGLTLAEKYPNQKILLIKRAQGGTALYGAWNPNWNAKQAKAIEKGTFKQNLKLYQMHIADINHNLELLKANNKSYEIYGLAWMQGENDAKLKVSSTEYKNNLEALITSYRRDMNSVEMPFVLGQINSRYGKKGAANEVRLNMKKFAQQDNFSTLIETSTDTSWSDYPKHIDNVHYNSEGLKRLGVAFANALIDIRNNKNINQPAKH